LNVEIAVTEKAEPPPGWGDDNLTDFIDHALENTYATVGQGRQIFSRLKDIDAAFRDAVKCFDNCPELYVSFFLLRSHSSFLAASRLALSTQVYESYPVLRSCLEAALYGLFVAKRPKAQDIWIKRDDSPKDQRRMRRTFTIGAVFGVLKLEDKSLYPPIKDLYERTIDFGAHPNPTGILGSVQMHTDETGVKIETHYLTDNSDHINLALKTTAQVGVGALGVFRNTIPHRFEIMGLNDRISKLSSGL